MQRAILARIGYTLVGSTLICVGLGSGAAQAGAMGGASTTSTTAAAQAKGTFGPKGYDGIKLGMSVKKAKATGKIKHELHTDNGKCSLWEWKNHRDRVVYTSKKFGVVGIVVSGKARTPEGIGVGATKTKLKKAYPKIKFDKITHQGTVKLPGKPKAAYTFDIEDGKVSVLYLITVAEDCE
ncbi:hypothetical protein J5X84_02830 [Streptosporangiaceae bacterium NEAU-GS5]|nr:hypothetical protein [Streptosporangiaceae bacterium NEAU-GS5]